VDNSFRSTSNPTSSKDEAHSEEYDNVITAIESDNVEIMSHILSDFKDVLFMVDKKVRIALAFSFYLTYVLNIIRRRILYCIWLVDAIQLNSLRLL
jgi:hypothetical protein